ncbi:MAG: hypothetical protein OEW45_12785 [Deltaproteobacteria bacterium]|nr:hypothetical protein [Deltaproteobacteria bacterium]
MPKKGSKPPYKPKIEYRYTVKDVAEAAGMTRKALSVAKFWGKVDPGDFKSMVSFLTRRIIDKRLKGDLFAPAARVAKRGGRTGSQVSGKRPKKAVRRR